MFPGIYEFRWDAGHVVFLGAFFMVLACMGTLMIAATIRTVRDFMKRRVEAIRWEEEFHGLPATSRRCRHELSGRVEEHSCSNGFDCRNCAFNAGVLDQAGGAGATRLAEEDSAKQEPGGSAASGAEVFGFEMPADRLYHRGHAWVQVQDDGTFKVGLDDFGSRLMDGPDGAELPEKGSCVQVNGTGWRLSKGGAKVRVLSPVEGIVIETGGPDEDCYLWVKPAERRPDLGHLLCGAEVRSWLQGEIGRLQKVLTPQTRGAALADGGTLAGDFAQAYLDADWDAIWGDIFLEG